MGMNGSTTNSYNIEIWAEGKTDWIILQKAQEKLGLDLSISFQQHEGDRGDKKLLQILKTYAEKPNNKPMLFIFDHDVESTIKEVDDPEHEFKNWGNNVFSFSIPIPPHRNNLKSACIELYFSDDEIKTFDSDRRRLFLTNEFNSTSGKHTKDATINFAIRGVLKNCAEDNIKIIDSEVYDKDDKSVALSKIDFANNIKSDIIPFNKFNFEHFRVIFALIDKVLEFSLPRCTLCLPDLDKLFSEIDKLDTAKKYKVLFDVFTNILELTLLMFSTISIRFYEEFIVNDTEKYRKKLKPITNILDVDFVEPSLEINHELALKCFYLVDRTAPDDLIMMKTSLETPILLGDIGRVIDNLEQLFPPELGTPILVNKPNVKKGIIDYVVPECVKYTSKSNSDFYKRFNEAGSFDYLNLETWKNALKMLIVQIDPIFLRAFVSKTLEKVDTQTKQYSIKITTYQSRIKRETTALVPAEEVEQYQINTSEMILSDNTKIKLFPFIVIVDDSLYAYKKTRAIGYEYHSLKENKVYFYDTKKKFNHSLFRSGSTQELFWTEAPPVVNPANGVKANIPSAGFDKFVGRLKQKETIFNEIIEIPNQNGIVFGHGGIGKTALLINISQKLFNESDRDNIFFKNIVWVSAKSDYYDYIFDSIENRKPQFKSLDAILSSILKFFEYEGLEEYDFEDKKNLVLDIFEGNKILLILDNLETVPSGEIDNIIKFFEVEVKRKLRTKPDNFKVILTSRKQIPSGFHQIELTGLDNNESTQLIDNLYERYKKAKPELTNTQKQKLHEVTKGIPLVIKHCIARIYEYNDPINQVIMNLATYESQLVQFSFKEILNQIQNDKEKTQLHILLLLEDINRPLMVRQIADILEEDVIDIENDIPVLTDYQCVRKANQDNQEKYFINPEIKLLTSSLMIHHKDLVQEIRRKLDNNFPIERQMDYTPEEQEISLQFSSYLENGSNIEAARFIIDQLKKKPDSILLNYVYARYLSEQKSDIPKAIELLEQIYAPSGNNRNILRLLFSCFISSNSPDFEKIKIYADQLEGELGDEEDIKLELIEFYVKWSTSILKLPSKMDPLEEITRNSRIKAYASKALAILNTTNTRTPSTYYLFSQAYYNDSDYDSALRMINKAMKTSLKTIGSYPQSFVAFRELVLKQWERGK